MRRRGDRGRRGLVALGVGTCGEGRRGDAGEVVAAPAVTGRAERGGGGGFGSDVFGVGGGEERFWNEKDE